MTIRARTYVRFTSLAGPDSHGESYPSRVWPRETKFYMGGQEQRGSANRLLADRQRQLYPDLAGIGSSCKFQSHSTCEDKNYRILGGL